MKITKEVAFEDAIIESLLSEGGYTRGLPTHYDPAPALDTAELFAFIGATQAETWEDLVQRNGGDPHLAQRRFVDDHDVCRVHVDPSGHPVEAELTVSDEKGQFSKKRAFFVRLNNGTRDIADEM